MCPIHRLREKAGPRLGTQVVAGPQQNGSGLFAQVSGNKNTECKHRGCLQKWSANSEKVRMLLDFPWGNRFYQRLLVPDQGRESCNSTEGQSRMGDRARTEQTTIAFPTVMRTTFWQ